MQEYTKHEVRTAVQDAIIKASGDKQSDFTKGVEAGATAVLEELTGEQSASRDEIVRD